MSKPRFEQGLVTKAKICDYLLDFTHPQGWSKAIFFSAMGYQRSHWEILARDLTLLAARGHHCPLEGSEHGRKHLVQGILVGPTGVPALVRTVWIVDRGRTRPRFVTAYPGGMA